MPTYSQSSPIKLHKRLQELREEADAILEASIPTLVAEMRLIESLLETLEMDTYAEASGPLEAINRCLDIHGDWKLTKDQIMKEILNGGYVKHKKRSEKPTAARGLLNDSLNNQLGKPKKVAKLALKGDKVGRP
jgi:hypothetical protein